MRARHVKHIARIMQEGPPAPTEPEALPPEHAPNRRQRRMRIADNRRLTHEIAVLTAGGSPISVKIGNDGRLHAVADKKALKQLEREKLRKVTGEPEIIAEVSGSEMPELPAGSGAVFDIDLGLGP